MATRSIIESIPVFPIRRVNSKKRNRVLDEALQKAELLKTSVLDAIPYAVIGLNEHHIIFANKSVETVFGWKPEELIGKTARVLCRSKKEYEEIANHFYSVLERQQTYSEEFACRHKDGREIMCMVSASKIGNSIEGKEIVVVYENITKRKRSEEALKQSEEKYRFLVENSDELIFILSKRGKILFANKKALNSSGYSKEEIVGKSILKFLTKDSISKAFYTLGREFLGQPQPTFEIKIKIKSGEIRNLEMEHGSTPVYENGKLMGILVNGRDVTERKRLEEQLRQAQKMEAIGTLAGGVAHDFNNILTGIQGYADLALAEIPEDDLLCRDLNEIRKAAARAANLTRQLLLFSRRQPMEMASVNLNTTIDDMLKMLNRLIGENISITTVLADSLWTINADPGTIEQVIMNLVVNARDAMPEGGEISIKTENVTVDEQYCRTYRYARTGEFVCVSVQDTGVGMNQATIDRIFEPFFSTKGVGKGTGLGLSVVYGIVKKHEGWINVESSPGKGTIFKIYLLAVSEETEEVQEQKTPAFSETFRGEGERILLVEDDEAVRELARKALSGNGYTVFAAANAQESLDVFQKEKGDFDLIFSDVVLPDGSGPKLADRLLELKPGISVLFTSGYNDEKSDWRTIQEGGYPYLQKPYVLSDLLKVVNDALKKN